MGRWSAGAEEKGGWGKMRAFEGNHRLMLHGTRGLNLRVETTRRQF